MYELLAFILVSTAPTSLRLTRSVTKDFVLSPSLIVGSLLLKPEIRIHRE